ncbi:prepilin-type N-terminal cleavage/methylation domain-containing protein [Candidatus Parcubacteria bacterium]|nr:MAG: prepilin-type N-terminal cleavage/methylation domain-containing protein [Candidatus Parcubacteria bacterium]
MKKEHSQRSRVSTSGFSLVELLVSMGLFSVVVSVAVGGFIGALRSQRQAAALVAAESNVSFAIEQIAREIRTGHYFCDGTNTTCASPSELAFVDGNGATVFYRLNNESIEQSVGGNANFQKITGDNVSVRYLVFRLQGNLRNDNFPPRVTISVGVAPKASPLLSPVRLQTTVSARILDS